MAKFKFTVFIICVAVTLTFIQTSCNVPSTEDIKAYFEVLNMQSKWVKKYYSPWPPKLILVPAISFQVKNLSDKPLKFVYFNAVFKQVGEIENRGDNLFPAMTKEPLLPGEVSDVIFMKSNYGVEGKNLLDFKSNPGWRPWRINLFAKVKGSRYALLGEWNISKEIDFEEAEPEGKKK